MSGERLALVPMTQREAFAFVRRLHRHHLPPRGALFCIGAARAGEIVGVVIAGRPVARLLDDGWTAEVTRLCTVDGEAAHNAASMLYRAAWRAARAMGYQRLVTYTLATEPGTSLRAAGARVLHQTRDAASWSRANRPRVDLHPLEAKTLWQIGA